MRRAIEAAYRGEIIVGSVIAGKVLDHFGSEAYRKPRGVPYEGLSPRELEVLQLASEGLSNKEIAGRLVISEKTVKNHVANIFSKLQVNDRTQAVLYALRKGLVTLPRDEP